MATDNINQKQGVINKCPSCGGPLKAFVSRCELCGHELAGVGANRTISDLVERFNEIERELAAAGIQGSKLEKELIARKGRVIRDFPIPNAREDLQSLLHFIHPKIQDNIKPDANAEDWRVKFIEVMSLAKNAYKGDAQTRQTFEEMERSLNVTLSGALQSKAKRSPVLALTLVTVAVLAIAGVVGIQMEKKKAAECEERYVQGAATEKARLDGIMAAASTKQLEKKYPEALTALNGLQWNYRESCRTEDAAREDATWQAKRKELVARVQQAQSDETGKQQDAQKREDETKRAAAEQELAGKLDNKAQQKTAASRTSMSKEW